MPFLDHFLQGGPFKVTHTCQFVVVEIKQAMGSTQQMYPQIPSTQGNPACSSASNISGMCLTDKATTTFHCLKALSGR